MKKYDFFSNKMTWLEIILTIPLFTGLVFAVYSGGEYANGRVSMIVIFPLIHFIFNLKSKMYMTHFINTLPIDRVRYTRQLGKYIITKMLCVVITSGVILALIYNIYNLSNLGFLIHFILLSVMVTCSLYYFSTAMIIERKPLLNFNILFIAVYYEYLITWPLSLIVDNNYSILNISIFLIVALLIILLIAFTGIKSLVSTIPDTGESYDTTIN